MAMKRNLIKTACSVILLAAANTLFAASPDDASVKGGDCINSIPAYGIEVKSPAVEEEVRVEVAAITGKTLKSFTVTSGAKESIPLPAGKFIVRVFRLEDSKAPQSESIITSAVVNVK